MTNTTGPKASPEHEALLERWRMHLVDMVEEGLTMEAASQAMLETAMAARMVVSGPRDLARGLYLSALQANAVANSQDRQPRH